MTIYQIGCQSRLNNNTLLLVHAKNYDCLQVIPLRSAWVMTAVFSRSCNLVGCGGMDNQLTIYDINNRDTSGAAKMLREFAGYEGFLSSCR